jgi:transcription elongation factor GreB
MARYRPPAKPKSPYITRSGYDSLKRELEDLWKTRREVVQALSAAAAEGDRSENAEYIYRKKQLREIDRRIRYLQKRLPELKIVDTVPSNPQQVFFGAIVYLEDIDENQVIYRIVGPDEFDPKTNAISMDSPVARALMKKSIDDEVVIKTPGGIREYVIIDVSYREESTG